jgi:hypothetical protein
VHEKPVENLVGAGGWNFVFVETLKLNLQLPF